MQKKIVVFGGGGWFPGVCAKAKEKERVEETLVSRGRCGRKIALRRLAAMVAASFLRC